MGIAIYDTIDDVISMIDDGVEMIGVEAAGKGLKTGMHSATLNAGKKGDGIGPEVVDLMLNVLNECNMQAEIINCEAGSEQWEKNGSKDKSYIPDVTMDALKE